MRASGLVASVAFGALVVGFGAGWITRGMQRPPSDDVTADAPKRKPAASASTAPLATLATLATVPTPTPYTPPTPTPWTYPSSLPPGLCDPPTKDAFSWPTTPAPPKGLVRVDDTHYLLDTAFVDELMEKQAELMKSARIVPEMKDGKNLGVRLFGVRPTSKLASIGFQNGDLLVCLSGYSMASPEQALEAYAKLRGAKDSSVGLVRDGKGVVLHYHVTSGKKSELADPFE